MPGTSRIANAEFRFSGICFKNAAKARVCGQGALIATLATLCKTILLE